ncbi:substrate-binding periplasmic protein [Sphingobium sp. RAC03]|uniref:substrate-binding periplasmic protein n=1 Tax=Sphingobium sp. RAC03 TaxID=1843368 RepID=UPI00083D5D51|nr:transporter substrate-binding domain-containing protein [Sphingobium sp. RAC03]
MVEYCSAVLSRLVGIDVDLARACASELGVSVEFMELLAGEDVDEDLRNAVWRGPLIGGQPADVMMHVPYDRTFALRNDRVVIVAPYYRERFAMICDRNAVDCEMPPPQFKGQRLAAELDSIPDFYLSGSFGGVLRNDVAHLPSGAAAIEAVRSRQAVAAMATKAQVEHALFLGGDTMVERNGALPALTSPGWDVGLAVKDDSRDLGDRLEAILALLQSSGVLATIFARYGVKAAAPLAG